MEDRLILTAASSAFGPSVLALLGSLNLNWPGHPPVRVYDIGLDKATLRILENHGIDVARVPEFCPHWRKHFTWKIWAWNDAPARSFLWLDAGLVVLKPMDEVFEAIERMGYFVVPTYHPLTENASEAACAGCGVSPDFRKGKMTLAGTLIGFQKDGKYSGILHEALSVALVEGQIAATDKMHRHDQAIMSLLLYRTLGEVVMSDGVVYCGWLSPLQTPEQKVWVHRRMLLPEDQKHFEAHISRSGASHMPRDARAVRRSRVWWRRLLSRPYGRLRGVLHRMRKPAGDGVKPYNGVRE
jgi:hypothetical protein